MTGFVAMFFIGVLLLMIFDALTGDNDRDLIGVGGSDAVSYFL